MIAVYQEGPMDADERISQGRFPLRYTGLVTQLAAIGSMDIHLGITGLNVQHLTGKQRYTLSIGAERYWALHLRMVAGKPSVYQ